MIAIMDLWDFYNIPVAQYVNKSIVKVSDKDSVQKAVELMAQKNIGCLIVDYEGGKVGIVSERDIVREYAMELYDFFEASVSDIMTVCPVMIDISDKLGRAFELMHKHHIRHLPVSENGGVVGVVSLRDLADSFIDNLPKKDEKASKKKIKTAAKCGVRPTKKTSV